MKIWISRHGQTDLNLQDRWQGRIDMPLNENGKAQARAMRQAIGPVHFDRVYASPLNRAIETASIIGDVPYDQIITDSRLIEADFGKYDTKKYSDPSVLPLALFWRLPEILPAPRTVETVDSLVRRSSSFLKEIEAECSGMSDVLVTCHGGIMRALTGYLADRKNGIVWRPRPKNCEIRVFESVDGTHRFIRSYTL